MNYIDAIILGVLGLFTVLGLVNGLIKQVGSLLGFFVGIWTATHFYSAAMPFISPLFTQWPLIAEHLSRVVSFFVVLYLASLLFKLLVIFIDKLFHLVAIIPLLKTVNRLGGAGVGFLEGLLLVSAVLFLFMNVPITDNFTKSLESSVFAPKIEKISVVLTPLLPSIDSFIPKQLKEIKMPTQEEVDTLKTIQDHVK